MANRYLLFESGLASLMSEDHAIIHSQNRMTTAESGFCKAGTQEIKSFNYFPLDLAAASKTKCNSSCLASVPIDLSCSLRAISSIVSLYTLSPIVERLKRCVLTHSTKRLKGCELSRGVSIRSKTSR